MIVESERLDVAEIARVLRVDVETVRRWIRTEGLAAQNVGTLRNPRYRVRRGDLERFLAGRDPRDSNRKNGGV